MRRGFDSIRWVALLENVVYTSDSRFGGNLRRRRVALTCAGRLPSAVVSGLLGKMGCAEARRRGARMSLRPCLT